MYDSHCHLDCPEFDADRALVVERARQAGVSGMFVPGLEPRTWERTAAFSRESQLHFGLGIHPHYLFGLTDAELSAGLAELAASAKRLGACAIGECGLDGGIAKMEGIPIERQRQILDAQLEVARALELPVVLHSWNATAPMLECITRHGELSAGGVLHSYSGPADLVPHFAKLGLSFSFAGIITRPSARKPLEALRAVPLERLLLETDAPDQAPFDAPSKRSEPAWLPRIVDAAAQIRGVPALEVAEATERNAQRMFAHS